MKKSSLKRKLSVIAVLLCLILVFTGCAKSKPETPTPKPDNQGQNNQQTPDPKPQIPDEKKFDTAAAYKKLTGIWMLCQSQQAGEPLIINPRYTSEYIEIEASGESADANLTLGDYYYEFSDLLIVEDEYIYPQFEGEKWYAYLISADLPTGVSYCIAPVNDNLLHLTYENDLTGENGDYVFVRSSYIDTWVDEYFALNESIMDDSYWVSEDGFTELRLYSSGYVHCHKLIQDEYDGQYYYEHMYYDSQWELVEDTLTIRNEWIEESFRLAGGILVPAEENRDCTEKLLRDIPPAPVDIEKVLPSIEGEYYLCATLVEGSYEEFDPADELSIIRIYSEGDGYKFEYRPVGNDNVITGTPMIWAEALYEGFLNEDWYAEIQDVENALPEESFSFAMAADGRIHLRIDSQSEEYSVVGYGIYEAPKGE